MKRQRVRVSGAEEVAQAWVGACEAGDLAMVALLLPLVERGPGVNCADRLGVTGLLAALETGQLEVVERLLDHPDIHLDFTKADKQGRTALDMVIISKTPHYIETILDMLYDEAGGEEFHKMLLPRLVTCATQGKASHFQKILEYYDVNSQEGALLETLLTSANTKFVRLVLEQCGGGIDLQDGHRRMFLAALRGGHAELLGPAGRGAAALANSVFRLFRRQLASMFREPRILGSAAAVAAVQVQVFAHIRAIFDIYNQKKVPSSAEIRKDLETGLGCIDVNMADGQGDTLLMLAVRQQSLWAVEVILARPSLHVNMVNLRGEAALDLVAIPRAREGDRLEPWLLPAASRATMAPLPSPHAPGLTSDLRLILLFLERNRLHKDVDFNFTREMLLVRALRVDKLDLARLVLTHCSYTISGRELGAALRLVAEGPHQEWRRGLAHLLARLAEEEGVQAVHEEEEESVGTVKEITMGKVVKTTSMRRRREGGD